MSDAPPKSSQPPIPTTDQILDAMRRAAAEELERKRRLGHYAVHWEDGRVVLRGEDAPLAADDLAKVAEPGRLHGEHGSADAAPRRSM